jgi:hypothetical protein
MIWHFIVAAILLEKERRHLTLKVPNTRSINEGKALYTKKSSTSIFTLDRRH